MNKKRTGFTLAEVLMALVIMGLIAAVAVPVIRTQKSSYTALAYYAYDNLKKITGEIMLSEQQGNVRPTESMTKHVIGPSEFEERMLKNDGELAANDNRFPERTSFCEYMASMMNTQGLPQCNTINNNFDYIEVLNYRFTLPENTEANIVTTNGQKYYIGNHRYQDEDTTILEDGTEIRTSYGYRLILVDLNGDARPNTMVRQPNSAFPPDIVAFAVLDTGEVLPVGIAANDVTVGRKNFNYLTSKINGFTYSRNKASHNPALIPKFCTNTGGFGTRCSYSKAAVTNSSSSGIKFSFRQAYCSVNHGESQKLKDYCNNVIPNPLCPPSGDVNTYDVCKQEVIKPMFRFNFR